MLWYKAWRERILLGLGGLAREREERTVGFTLALPLRRRRLVVTRAVVGFAQVILLATIPAIVLPLLPPLVGQAYPSSQAWAFTILWAIIGSLIFAMGFVASILFGAEFTAPVAALLGLAAYSLLWATLAAIAVATLVHIVIGVRITARQDF